VIDVYDATKVTTWSLIERIKFLAMAKSPRGQGFLSVALALPNTEKHEFRVSDRVFAYTEVDLAAECPAGKVLLALGDAVVRGGRLDLPSSALLEDEGRKVLEDIENTASCKISLSADIVSTVRDRYCSSGPYTAMEASWLKIGV